MNSKDYLGRLERIADGTVIQDDYDLLSTRFYSNNITHANTFQKAVCIMSRNVDIDNYNYDSLQNLKQPVALINAIHYCSTASTASADEVHGLLPVLRLCKGAKVLL